MCAFTLAGCVSTPLVNQSFSPAYASAVSLCDLVSHSDNYVGRRVTVRGLYGFAPHARVLFEVGCPSRDLVEIEVHLDDSDATLRSDRQMERLLHTTGNVGFRAIYSGVLEYRPIVVIDTVPKSFSYSIVDARLESAEWTLR